MNYTEEFELFWQAYPKSRRHNKEKTRKYWQKIRPESYPKVMAGLNAWCAKWRRLHTEEKFIPWSQKFLNDRYYADDWIEDDIRQRLLAERKAVLNPPRIKTEPVIVYKDGIEVKKPIPVLGYYAKRFMERIEQRKKVGVIL